VPRKNTFAEFFFDLKNPNITPITADPRRSMTRRT